MRRVFRFLARPAALKVATYGVMHFCIAIAVAFAITGDIAIALAVGVIEPMVQTAAFAVHERLWARRGMSTPVAGDCGHTPLAFAFNRATERDVKPDVSPG